MKSFISAVLLTVGAYSTASASHFRGAAMIPSVDSSGLLTINTTSFWRPTFTSFITEGAPMSVSGAASPIRIAGPVNDTSDIRFTRVTETYTTRLSGAGTYDISTTSCCRVGGILNANEDSWTMNSSIFWDGSTANNPIQFNFSAVQPEVLRNANYNGNLGATAGPGLNLSYNQTLNQNINSQPPGFTVNSSTGALFIPAASTNTYGDNGSNIGADYAFSGNILATNGSGGLRGSVEFDWLFDAVSGNQTNSAPSVTDALLNVTVGQTVNYMFAGTDPDGDLLTWQFLNLLGPGAALAPTFNPATQQFVWDTTGSLLGTYIAQVQASDGFLTDVGQLTINVTNSSVPEPASMSLIALGIAAGLFKLRRKSR